MTKVITTLNSVFDLTESIVTTKQIAFVHGCSGNPIEKGDVFDVKDAYTILSLYVENNFGLNRQTSLSIVKEWISDET